MKLRLFHITLALAALAAQEGMAAKLKGKVHMDGSSTVFPLAEAVAEEFRSEAPRVRVTAGLSGTGGGFKKFAAGETDISTASRPIKAEEKEQLKKAGINYMEIPVAYDGLSVVLNLQNDFATNLSLAELKAIWEPGSKVKTWKDVRPSFPNEAIKLYGPGADSGTFDYFTEAVMGKARQSRSDYVSSEDDNVLVRGISADKYAMGYFGYAYYLANKKQLNIAALAKDGKNFIPANAKTIESATYPLSRPLLMYVNLDAAKERKALAKFVEFFIENSAALSKEVGYIPLPKQAYAKSLENFRKAVKTRQTH